MTETAQARFAATRGRSWPITTLGQLASFRNGVNFTKASRGQRLKIVGVKDFTGHASVPLDQLDDVVVDGKIADDDLLQRNDVLFVRSNGSVDLIGRCLLVEDVLEPTTFSGFTIRARLTAGANVLPPYVFRALCSDHLRARMIAGGNGANIKSLNQGILAALPIPVPPLSEQQRLVDLLDEAFEGIAKAKASAEKNLENARDVFAAVRHQAFDSRDGSWRDVTLDAVAENLDSKRVPITRAARQPGPYPYYGASGVVDQVAEFIFDEETLLISEDGANLLSRTTPIAFVARGKYWVNNHAHVLRFKSRVTQRYVEEYIESISIKSYVTGAAQPKLTQKALYQIPIPLPRDESTQAEIVTKLDELREAVNRAVALYEGKLAALDELKKSLLHHAFTGAL